MRNALFALTLSFLAFISPSRAVGLEIAGQVRVIDGDTIDVAGQRVRLFGIDAPEGRQTCTLDGRPWNCGQESAEALRTLLANKTIRCHQKDIDRYKRIVGVCFVDTTNVNDVMVRNGWALAYRQYSKDYVPAEAEASRNKAGIWRGNFQNPWDWRRKRK